ncbi:MAG: hypothetical protein WCI76_02200 [bacterium]
MQNDKRYWLRGGVTAIILMGLVFSLGYIANDFLGPIILAFFILPLLTIVFIETQLYAILGVHTLGHSDGMFFEPSFIGYVLIVIIFFTIGAFLGWLYGKSKDRKKATIL